MTGVEDVSGAESVPLHVFRTRVWFDELDKVGVLHNARYAVHVERALADWYESRAAELGGVGDGDQLVKAYEIEFRRPVVAVGELDVELRVAKLGTTSCSYGFRVVGAGEQRVVYAVGTRTVVNVAADGAGALRPVAWSEEFRRVHGE